MKSTIATILLLLVATLLGLSSAAEESTQGNLRKLCGGGGCHPKPIFPWIHPSGHHCFNCQPYPFPVYSPGCTSCFQPITVTTSYYGSWQCSCGGTNVGQCSGYSSCCSQFSCPAAVTQTTVTCALVSTITTLPPPAPTCSACSVVPVQPTVYPVYPVAPFYPSCSSCNPVPCPTCKPHHHKHFF